MLRFDRKLLIPSAVHLVPHTVHVKGLVRLRERGRERERER